MCRGVKGRSEPVPSHQTESRGLNISTLIWIGEGRLRERLWLVVLQCISYVFGTEKEMPRRDALASSFSKSSWSQWILPGWERDAIVMAKLSTY